MSPEGVAAALQANPFPGLRPFREEEEYLFFGRESQVDAMVDKLAATRFLAVVGTSGSGKSSLVNCGLRPALRLLCVHVPRLWWLAQDLPESAPQDTCEPTVLMWKLSKPEIAWVVAHSQQH